MVDTNKIPKNNDNGTQNEHNKRCENNLDKTYPDMRDAYIDSEVIIEEGAVIHPMVVLKGKTRICSGAVVYPFCDLTDTIVGEDTEIRSTYSLGATIGKNCTVGPFACLRKGTTIGDGCRVGNFVEVKNSNLSDGVKCAHLAYVGDSSVGENTNIGCGVVFANYDGKKKQAVNVGKKAFIGCNSNLVAPLNIGDGAYIAAGSTVTEDVPPATLCIARARQVVKSNLPNLE